MLLEDLSRKMKGFWDRHIRATGLSAIAPEGSNEVSFNHSGKRDVGIVLKDLRELPLSKMNALDIGCGAGRMVKFLAPIFKEVYCVDLSTEAILKARDHLRQLTNVNLIQNNGSTLSFLRDSTLDFIYSWATFQHMPEPVVRSYFEEVHGVLKPGGIFKFQVVEFLKWRYLITNPFIAAKTGYHRLIRARKQSTKEDNTSFFKTYPWKTYTRRQLRNWLSGIGFELIHFQNITDSNILVTALKSK